MSTTITLSDILRSTNPGKSVTTSTTESSGSGYYLASGMELSASSSLCITLKEHREKTGQEMITGWRQQ